MILLLLMASLAAAKGRCMISWLIPAMMGGGTIASGNRSGAEAFGSFNYSVRMAQKLLFSALMKTNPCEWAVVSSEVAKETDALSERGRSFLGSTQGIANDRYFAEKNGVPGGWPSSMASLRDGDGFLSGGQST
jgi:hypothetical protein